MLRKNISVMLTDERGDDVIFGIDLALCSQFVGVHVQLSRRRRGVLGRTSKVGVGGSDHGVGPVENLATVLDRDANQFGNGDQR